MDTSHIVAGALAEIMAREISGVSVFDESPVTVGLSVTEVAVSDPERVMLIFVNLSAANIYIGPSNLVSATRGIQLSPTGGTAILTAREDGALLSTAWSAIGQVSGGTLYRITLRRHVGLGPGRML